MRVLFTAHQFFPDHGAGVETVTLGLARELKARGHEPYVFAAKRSVPHSNFHPGETEDYEVEGVPVRRIGRPEEGLSRPYELNYRNEEIARRASEYARKVSPDVIHLMHLQGLSASVVETFSTLGVPLVYTAADFWTICPVVDLRRHDGALCEGPETHHCVRCIASRSPDGRVRKAAKLVPGAAVRLADVASRTPLARFSGALRQVRAVGERPVYISERMRSVDHVLAYTRLTRELLLRNGVGADNKTSVSHYGIDTSGIFPSASSGRARRGTLRVGYIGTLAPHKGCDVLIRAFRKLPAPVSAALSIHGDDARRYAQYARELRELAGEDRRVSFAGSFGREDLGRVLSEMDVLVVPSRWYENAPGVVFEAFAAGLPVVATDLGGLSELVRDGKDGLLFALEDDEDLARQLARLAEETGLLERLREGVQPVKTVAEYADEVEGLYATLVEKAGGV